MVTWIPHIVYVVAWDNKSCVHVNFVIYNIIIIDNNFDDLLNIDNIYFDQMVARITLLNSS